MKKLIKKRKAARVTLYGEGNPGLFAVLLGAYADGGACDPNER